MHLLNQNNLLTDKHPSRCYHRFVLTCFICVSILFCISSTGHCQTSGQNLEILIDQRLLSGLRQRELFQLAEFHCKKELSKKTSLRRRATLTAELIYTLSQRAVYSNPDQREAHWTTAQKVASDFTAQNPKQPYLLVVQFQAAKAELTHGKHLRQEAELLPQAAKHLKTASRQLVVASLKFAELEKEIAEAKRKLARNKNNQETLSQRELLALESNIQFQLARTFRNIAQCYSFGSSDQVDALTQSQKRLIQLISGSTVPDIYWSIRLDQVDILRLQRKFSLAQDALKKIVAEKPPKSILEKAIIHSAMLSLDQQKIEPALKLLKQLPTNSSKSGERDYVTLKCLIAAWKITMKNTISEKQTKQAALWKKQVIAKVQEIETRHSGYWSRRAALLVAGSLESTSSSTSTTTSTTLLAIAARNYYLAHQYRESIEAYQKAAKLSKSEKKAFDWLIKAASIRQRHDKLELAIQQYLAASQKYSKQPQAASVHLHAILLLKKNKKIQIKQSYEEQLKQHLKLWPKNSTTDQVRQLFGDLMMQKKQWIKAIESYRTISNRYQFQDYIHRRTTICYQAACAELSKANQPVEKLAHQAANWIDQTIIGNRNDKTPGKKNRWPKKWTETQRWMILAAAEIRLRYTTDGYSQVEQALSAALKESAAVDQTWKQTANAFLIQALVGQKKQKRATDLLKELAGSNPTQLLSLVTRLSKIADPSNARVVKEVALLQLEMIRLIEGQKNRLTKQQKINFVRLRAKSLTAVGKHQDAVADFAKLAKQNPKNAVIQEEYAQLLEEGSSRASSLAAQNQWRYCLRHHPRGKPAWFRAKYGIVLMHHRLGNRDQVKKIVTLLQSLYPKLGGPTMEAKFKKLVKTNQ